MPPLTVTVAGAGPAGASAAIAARLAGADVRIFEKSAFPRHKVCGEYLSPEILPLFEKLGVAAAFHALRPHRFTRLELHFPRAHKRAALPEPAYGLSRFELDRLLLDRAIALGAGFERGPAPKEPVPPVVIATGRRFRAERGERLFGFKAHYTGPQDDAISLYFFDGCYVGVNAVEGGRTNVCGLGPEYVLQRTAFEPDGLFDGFPALRERLAPLTRSWDWLTTGPLLFRDRMREAAPPGHYYAGDGLSFVDPFTGSGMLSAVLSGQAAGLAAALGTPSEEYMRQSDLRLRPALRFSAALRWTVDSGWAERLLPLAPANLLVSWTRPRV